MLQNRLSYIKLESILFFMRLFSSIGFGMLYAGLTIFLIKNLHFEENLALSLVGIFIALHYSLALFGGIFAGTWISLSGALATSVLLSASAIWIIYNNSVSFFLGSAIFLASNLAGTTSINMLITRLFPINNNLQERVFMRNYAAQNLGNIIGFSIAGYFELFNKINHINYIATPLMLITFILCIIFRKDLADNDSFYSKLQLKLRIRNNLGFFTILIIGVFIIQEILKFSYVMSNILFIVISAAIAIILVYNCKGRKAQGLTFIILAISNLLFWSLYFLIPTGLMLFAKYNTTGTILGYQFPSAWLPNINSLIIIVGAPLLSLGFKYFDKNNNLSIANKFIIGLLCFCAALSLLAFGITIAHTQKISMWWLFLTYTLITISELFIVPIGFSAIGKYVPVNRQYLMTGAWMATLGLGGIISSKLSALARIKVTDIYSSNQQFLLLFVSLAVITLIFTAILYRITKNKTKHI